MSQLRHYRVLGKCTMSMLAPVPNFASDQNDQRYQHREAEGNSETICDTQCLTAGTRSAQTDCASVGFSCRRTANKTQSGQNQICCQRYEKERPNTPKLRIVQDLPARLEIIRIPSPLNTEQRQNCTAIYRESCDTHNQKCYELTPVLSHSFAAPRVCRFNRELLPPK